MMTMTTASIYREGKLVRTLACQWQETAEGWTTLLDGTETENLAPGTYTIAIPHPTDPDTTIGRMLELRPNIGPDLLRRYVAHVRRTIGDECLLRTDRLLSARKGITFTDDEWAHLWSMVADD